MRQTKTNVKMWSGARPEKMEGWLERMASEGWHLTHVHWGGVKFTFEKTEPQRVCYCIDYRTEIEADYIALLEDDGWELMLNSAGWLIWRKPYEEARPDIYTDVDSIIQRNNRMLGVYGVLLVIQAAAALMNIANYDLFFLLLLYIPVVGLLGGTYLYVWIGNKELKAKHRKP